MNPPPGSPEPEYQQIWEEGELHRLLQHSMPKLAERLNEEIANNTELSARCIDSVDQELKVDDTQSPHTNGLEVIPEDRSEQGVDCPEAEESVETLAMAGTPIEAPSQTTAAQQHNQENIPPVAKHLHDSSHINGTK